MSDREFALEGGLSPSLAIGIALVLAIEGAVLHLWIAQRSATWAWVVTVVNIATLVYLWREVRANTRSRLVLSEGEVEIVVGRRLRYQFSRSEIASAEVVTWR